MCKCTPNLRTPYCGKPGCEWPDKKKLSPIMRFFKYQHLPKDLAEVSSAICNIAKIYDNFLPDCAEKSAGLRKLLEAKDCFVRAALPEK